MPRLLATRWTRYHAGGSAEHPAGRVVDFSEHPDIKGPDGGPLWFADITADEAAALKSDEHDSATPMGWSLVLTDEEKAAAARKATADATKGKAPAKPDTAAGGKEQA